MFCRVKNFSTSDGDEYYLSETTGITCLVVWPYSSSKKYLQWYDLNSTFWSPSFEKRLSVKFPMSQLWLQHVMEYLPLKVTEGPSYDFV